MKSNTSSRRFRSAAFFSPRPTGASEGAPSPLSRRTASPLTVSPSTADGTTRISITFDVPNAELSAHLNTCALLDIVHGRRRRELGSILGGALRRLIPHYANYSVSAAAAAPLPQIERRAA